MHFTSTHPSLTISQYRPSHSRTHYAGKPLWNLLLVSSSGTADGAAGPRRLNHSRLVDQCSAGGTVSDTLYAHESRSIVDGPVNGNRARRAQYPMQCAHARNCSFATQCSRAEQHSQQGALDCQDTIAASRRASRSSWSGRLPCFRSHEWLDDWFRRTC